MPHNYQLHTLATGETQVAISYGVMDTVRSQSVLMANLRRLRHIGAGPDYGLLHWHVDLHKPIVWVCEIIRKGTPGRWREVRVLESSA